MTSPQIRRKARARAVEYVYSLELTGQPWEENLAAFWEWQPSKESVRKYAEVLISGIYANRESLEREIREALTNWSWDRIDPVERAILRVALFEMACCEDVPIGVAMNEAIELTKIYGGDDSPRFINGVLDSLKHVQIPKA